MSKFELEFKKAKVKESRHGGIYLHLPIINYDKPNQKHCAYLYPEHDKKVIRNFKYWMPYLEVNMIKNLQNITVEGLTIRDSDKGLINTDSITEMREI